MIRSSTILQHIKSAPLPKGALFMCLPKDSPTRHELLSRIVNPERRETPYVRKPPARTSED